MKKTNFLSQFIHEKQKDKIFMIISIIVLCNIAFQLVFALPIFYAISKHIGIMLIIPSVCIMFITSTYYIVSAVKFYTKVYKSK